MLLDSDHRFVADIIKLPIDDPHYIQRCFEKRHEIKNSTLPKLSKPECARITLFENEVVIDKFDTQMTRRLFICAFSRDGWLNDEV